jgi:hypothetical protein
MRLRPERVNRRPNSWQSGEANGDEDDDNVAGGGGFKSAADLRFLSGSAFKFSLT